MIFSKTPLRMSFVGGGSDLPSFYREHGGCVLSTSIARYIYIAVNRKFDGQIRVSYSRTEEVDDINKINHPLVRHCLNLVGVDRAIEIGSFADIPSKGSGLGSSSSYTVGLLNALYAFSGRYVSKEQLASEACKIEIERCQEPIGKQDQYAAAYGGLNLIEFHPDENVAVSPIICSSFTRKQFEDSILVFFTGKTRSASEVLARQSQAIRASDKQQLLKRMVELAYKMKHSLETADIASLGPILDENWRLKVQLSDSISDSEVDRWYQTGLKAGAVGGKLLGAGNGGFIMFLAPPELHDSIAARMDGLRRISFPFDQNGSQIAFFQPLSE
jgi:D-glycero-alpha-D-manno-heptose-7-phosphate kinase